VRPIRLAGDGVVLTAYRKAGYEWWVKVKRWRGRISVAGTYSWKYKPARKGTYRIQATLAETATHIAAATPWLRFRVK